MSDTEFGDAMVANATCSSVLSDGAAAPISFTSLYRDLHRVARQLTLRAQGTTLSAHTLLHECYLDMARRGTEFPDRARFIAYATRAMRGLIVDHLRERHALKRGGEFHLTALDTELGDKLPDPEEALRVGDALGDLQSVDAALAELVDLKFFCGFSFIDIATMRGVSERTVQRDWQKARLLLHRTLSMR